jgi:molybdopterin synthase catalytic subunit
VYVAITRHPIDPAEVLSRVGSAGDGAAVLFLGTVRDHNDGRPVRGLHYDAYASMAEAELGAIAAEAAEQLGGGSIAVVHRIGELAISDVAVAVAVSSPHRAAAFEAARYVIEEIKRRLPIWKQERYVSGGARWLEGQVPPVPEPLHE